MYNAAMHPDIASYNLRAEGELQEICTFLAHFISVQLPQAEQKLWHGAPVWFVEGNPVVGYNTTKKGTVRLLFWSGQTFEESDLAASGSFKAAEIHYKTKADIIEDSLSRWLTKAVAIQWDYKNIVKHRGVLERIR
jgi:hypothetical protein